MENLNKSPDFSRSIKIEASKNFKNYTVPENGYLFVQLSGRGAAYATLKIDNNTIGDIGSNANSYLNTITAFIPVKKGQIISYKSGFVGYNYEPQYIAFYYLK